jgi:ribosomal-protein-alanine N-acetyltransferase
LNELMINSVYVNLLSFSTNPSFVVSTLQSIGAEPLLKFELESRQWFERNIAARNAAFYSLEGFTDHVASYLSGLDNRARYPLVIEDFGEKIIGRANLKAIDGAERSAEVGCQIAANACESYSKKFVI